MSRDPRRLYLKLIAMFTKLFTTAFTGIEISMTKDRFGKREMFIVNAKYFALVNDHSLMSFLS